VTRTHWFCRRAESMKGCWLRHPSIIRWCLRKFTECNMHCQQNRDFVHAVSNYDVISLNLRAVSQPHIPLVRESFRCRLWRWMQSKGSIEIANAEQGFDRNCQLLDATQSSHCKMPTRRLFFRRQWSLCWGCMCLNNGIYTRYSNTNCMIRVCFRPGPISILTFAVDSKSLFRTRILLPSRQRNWLSHVLSGITLSSQLNEGIKGYTIIVAITWTRCSCIEQRQGCRIELHHPAAVWPTGYKLPRN
jgi:hypothetical protein